MKILENGKFVELQERHPFYKLINKIKQNTESKKQQNNSDSESEE